MKALGLDDLSDGLAQIEAIEQNSHIEVKWGIKLLNQLGGNCRQLSVFETEILDLFFLDIDFSSKWNQEAAKSQYCNKIVLALYRLISDGVKEPANSVHRFATLGLLGVVKDQIEGFSRPGIKSLEKIIGLLTKKTGEIKPMTDQKEIVDTTSRFVGLNVTAKIGDVSSTVRNGKGEDKELKIMEVAESKTLSQIVEEGIEFSRDSCHF